MAKYRVAAVGLGRWANILAAQYANSAQIELVGCFSRSKEKRDKFCAKWGGTPSESYEALLARADVDAIICTVPNDAHADIIEQALRAGKPVCTEKPISNNIPDAQRIIRAAKETGVPFGVLHSARRLGAVRYMKELIDSGRLGEVSTIEVNFSNERGLELEPGNWRGDPVAAPGGPLIQLGIHQVDNLQYLLGRIKKVFCFGKPMYTKVSNVTVAQTLYEFESGQQAYLLTNWACPGVFSINIYGTKANIFYTLDFSWWSNADVTDVHSKMQIQEFASMGDDPDNRVLKVTDLEIPVQNHLLVQIEDFLRLAKQGKGARVSAEEATHNLACILGAVRSIKEGRVVDVHEVEAGL